MTDDTEPPRGDYEVGYGRPPVETRFKKGVSRPKRRRAQAEPESHHVLLWRILQERCRVTRDGKVMWMSKAELVIERAMGLAEEGNATLSREIMNLLLVSEAGADEDGYVLDVDPDKPSGTGTYRRIIAP